MKRLELTADLETGFEAIDKQHRELFSWANALSKDDVLTDENILKEALNNLDSYVVYHFRTEEEAMDTYSYDQLKKHRAQHHRLMSEVGQLYGRVRREGASKGLLAELQYMFADWFNLHIKEWDKPLATFLKSKKASVKYSR
jgi:hemerythrin